MLKNYNELPDYMNVKDIHRLFDDLMNAVDESPNTDSVTIVNGLWELADRQWHTYTLLEPRTKERIENYINNILLSKIWKDKPIIFLRRILSIIGNLGLQKNYELVREMLDQNTESETKRTIKEFIVGVEKHKKGRVEDPYITLK